MAVSDVIIRSSSGGIITRIKDIAQIKDGFEENTIIPHLNGKPTIALSIRKSEEADNIRVCNRIKEKIAKINKTLPENVEILFANDESTTVKNSFGIVLWNGIIGFALVILILRLFMNLTLSIWVAMGIPFTFMGTIFLLPFFGSFLDTITLTSMIIVLGIIVDDAIIVSDSIYSRWQKGESPEQAAIEGTYQVWRPVLTTIATTLCAFAPMFFVSGTMGKFIYVIPLTVSLALIVSIAEAVVILPSHLSSSLKRTSRTSSNPSRWFESLRKSYQYLLSRLLRWMYLLIFLFMFLFYGVFQIGKHNLDVVLFPSEMAKQFFIIIELPDGSNLEKTTEMTQKVEKFIFASSSSVYGIKKEKYIHENILLQPLTDYSKYKVECENILQQYVSENFTPIIIRPATVCGYSPRQRLDVIVNILTNFAYNKRKINVFVADNFYFAN